MFRYHRTFVCAIACLTLALGSASAHALTKPFAATLVPHVVPTSSTTTYTLTLTNENATSTTIQLGSANLYPPQGFTIVSVTQPAVGSAAIVSNVIQYRDIAIQPGQSASFTFQAEAPSSASTYTWSIQAKQSNDFNGTGNDLSLDTANSNLTTTTSSSCCADLLISSQTHTPDPVTVSGDVQFSIIAGNNGPSSSTISLSDSVNAGTIVNVRGTGWTCSNTSTTATCSYGTVASGGSTNVLEIVVQAPSSPPGTLTCGGASTNGKLCNTATVSGPMTDPNSSNNTSADSATVAASNSASGFIYEPVGGKVTLPTVTTTGTPSQTVGGVTTFPAISSSNSFTYTMTAPPSPSAICPVNGLPTQCTFQINLTSDAPNGGIPADYTSTTNPVEVDIFCAATTCISPSAYTLFKSTSSSTLGSAIPPCGLGQFPCEQSETVDGSGNHTFVTLWVGGDPQVLGKALPG
ncbi:MAG: hypothetical protein ACYDCC_00765 [Actinomycetota bacterium]